MITLSLGSFGNVSLPDDSVSSLFAPSAIEMARLDTDTITKGVSALELMERAGRCVAEFVVERLRARAGVSPHVVIVCGPGNNGGDGLVVSRLLSSQGIQISTIIADAARYSPEVIAQLGLLSNVMMVGGDIPNELSSKNIDQISQARFEELLSGATLIVDALLGTGQREAPRGGIAPLVEAVTKERFRRPDLEVIAIDLPTGVNADTGAVYTPHIRADYTLSIEVVKRGLMQFPAREVCGDIRVVGIGISGRSGVEFSLIEGARIPKRTPRLADTHKGLQGRVLIIGGSAAMPGASALAALGALRAGAGLVSRISRSTWVGASVTPECMNVLAEGEAPYFVQDDLGPVCEAIAAADMVVIGPGLGRTSATGRFVEGCLQRCRLEQSPVVIDADALILIASEGIDIRGISGIITPHPGEAATMLKCATAEIQHDRFSAVKALYERYGVVSLLKGVGTLVWDGSQGGIIARGTPYLATAGSGDILSGILVACLKVCPTPYEAALQGAYIHAVAGERASAVTGGPIVASDIAWAAASVIGELES